MGYDQPGVFSQPADQLDGVLDPFALEWTRRLEKEIFAGIHLQVRAKRGGVLIRRIRRVVKVHYVWDDRDIDPTPLAHLGSGQGINHHMMDAGEARREGHLQVVADTVDQKTFSLPGKIVVVPNDRYPRFGNEFCQGETKRDMHRNRKRIFDDQQFEIKSIDKFIETIFEVAP